MKDNLQELILSCASWQAAQQVVDILLEKKLVEGTEILPAQARQTVHVIVHSRPKKLDKIRAETSQLSTAVIVSGVSLVQ